MAGRPPRRRLCAEAATKTTATNHTKHLVLRQVPFLFSVDAGELRLVRPCLPSTCHPLDSEPRFRREPVQSRFILSLCVHVCMRTLLYA